MSMPPVWHALTPEETASRLQSDLKRGLSSEWVRHHLRADDLPEVSQWRLAGRLAFTQVKGTVILILSAAGITFWFLGHRGDSIGILVSVIFAVVLGFLTDFRAEKALAMLKSLTEPTARVIRDGLQHEVPSRSLCAGDLVVLSAGHLVPADGRLVEAQTLSINEAMLTGEAAPVTKIVNSLADDLRLPERKNMAYAGTSIVEGHGRMVICHTGAETELGRIGGMVQRVEKEETPLERQAEHLGRRLAVLVLALCAVVTGIGLLLNQPLLLMLETGFLLAIAAIPEGLPAVTTVALASGVRRMVRAKSLVRRLSAVETLGSVNVICADKTGTMTENCMQVIRIKTPGRDLQVSGAGYAPTGSFKEGEETVDPLQDPALKNLFLVGSLCNNAELESHNEAAGDRSRSEENQQEWHIHGSPTEGAILTLATKAGLNPESTKNDYPRLLELPFNSQRKRMTVIAQGPDRQILSLVKGGASSLLPLCAFLETSEGKLPLTDELRGRLEHEASELAQGGHRVLAFGYRELGPDWTAESSEKDLTWLGSVVMTDPPRKGVREAIERLRQAGIKSVMLTGDQRGTAIAIGRELGLCKDEAEVLEGKEVTQLLERQDWTALERVTVFSRVTPEDKFAIVRAYKAAGSIVAMTGDGINDAPALKTANIGIAMGSQSADVAKEASDLVITDANYATLPAAVAEGRQIYANLQRAVRFLLLCSFSNIFLVMAAVAGGLPIPMTPLQILWLNLVVHIFPAIALSVTPGGEPYMSRPPRPSKEPILSWKMMGVLAFKGAMPAGMTLWVYLRFQNDLPLARTLTMATLALCLLLQVFPMLSEREPFFKIRQVFSAPIWLAIAGGFSIQAIGIYGRSFGQILQTVPLSWSDWQIPLYAACFCLGLMEAVKFLVRKLGLRA